MRRSTSDPHHSVGLSNWGQVTQVNLLVCFTGSLLVQVPKANSLGSWNKCRNKKLQNLGFSFLQEPKNASTGFLEPLQPALRVPLPQATNIHSFWVLVPTIYSQAPYLNLIRSRSYKLGKSGSCGRGRGIKTFLTHCIYLYTHIPIYTYTYIHICIAHHFFWNEFETILSRKRCAYVQVENGCE